LLLLFIGSAYYITNSFDEKNSSISQTITQQSLNITKQEKQHKVFDKKFASQEIALSKSNILQGDLAASVTQLKNELKNYQQENRELKQQISDLSESQSLIDDNVHYLNKTKGALAEFQHGKILSTQWISQQSPSNFTVVLGTYNNKIELFKFIENEAYYLQENLAFSKTTENGQEQLILLYGSFINRADAIQAIEKLPYFISNNNKEIKQFKEFQEEKLATR